MGVGLPSGHRGQKKEAWAEWHTATQGSSQKELPIQVALVGNELPITRGMQTKPDKCRHTLSSHWY